MKKMNNLDDVVKELDRAVNNKDLGAVLDCYEEDAILVIEPGRIAHGKSEISDFFNNIFQMEIKAYQITTHTLQVGDIALFTSKWVAEGQALNGEKFTNQNIATSVFRKGADDKWRLVIDNAFGPEVLKVK
jgi:uncharacterized protein (TIGR02246 family)